MKEDQETTSNERKPQEAASATSGVKAATGNESAKRKGEAKRRPKSDRLSHAVSAGQRK